MTSHWGTGAYNMFSTTATPCNYLQMLTSQNAGSPHLFVGGRSHYNEPVLNLSIKRRLTHFTAPCWAFTTNIPHCCKSLYVRLDDFQQSVKFSSSSSRQFSCQPLICVLFVRLSGFWSPSSKSQSLKIMCTNCDECLQWWIVWVTSLDNTGVWGSI